MRTWRDPEAGEHEHLRERPAYGSRPDDGSRGYGLGPRDYRRDRREGPRCGVSERGRPRVRSVQHRVGRCRNCREGKTGICLNVNGDRAGAAFGYVDMGGWIGGQADYVMAPYADFNLLKFPDKDQALEKIEDLTLLSDILPTGYDGAVKAGVTTGSTVYVAGAGPVGLACAAACQLLGAAVVIVGDMMPERLAQARSFGCETIDLRDRKSTRLNSS